MTSVVAGDATKTILETINFLNESMMDLDDGQEKEDAITSYCINLTKVLGKLPFDTTDATSAMKLVREHEWMFGSANTNRLRQSLSRSSESICKHGESNKSNIDFFKITQQERE